MAGVVRYTPGETPVIVTGHGLVAIGGGFAPAVVSRLWDEPAAGRGLAAVLEALTGAFGTSLAAIPPFAVAIAEGASVRLAVRGSFAVHVDSRSGVSPTRETVTGTGVTTWSERVMEEVTSVRIDVSAAASPSSEAPRLPIGDGVVLVSSIEWQPDGSEAPASSDAASALPPTRPQPVASPAPPASPAPQPVVPRLHAGGPQPVRGPLPTRDPDVIDSIPTVFAATAGDTLAPADQTLVPADDTIQPDDTLAPPDDSAAEAAPQAEAVPGGDHDGRTISVAQARELRESSAPPPLAPPRPPAPGRVRLSTGQLLMLDRTIVIGRRPRSTRVTGTDLPHLVAVDSPQQDISRSHVELRVEGDSIVATDLHTTNGTTLLRRGVDPMRLHPGEPTVVVPGDVIDLGDDVTAEILEIEGAG